MVAITGYVKYKEINPKMRASGSGFNGFRFSANGFSGFRFSANGFDAIAIAYLAKSKMASIGVDGAMASMALGSMAL